MFAQNKKENFQKKEITDPRKITKILFEKNSKTASPC